MLTSVLSPIQIAQPDPAPPWGWNPAATFLTAYNAQAEERRNQQEFQLGMELEKILLPAKIAKAEYDTKKFTYDAQLLEKIYRTQSAALDESYRGIRSAVGGGGGFGSGVAGAAGGGAVQQPSRFGPARYGVTTITAPVSTANQTPKPKPKWSVVQPAPTSTGP